MSHQRQKYRLLEIDKKYLIGNDRIVQLENVTFQWISDSQLICKTAWNEQFSELLEFKQDWGHCNVFDKYAQCTNLGNWLRYQRRQYRLLKSVKKSCIDNERIVQLEDVGFQWISDSQLIPNMTWNKQLSELLNSNQHWGHCNVPQKYSKD